MLKTLWRSSRSIARKMGQRLELAFMRFIMWLPWWGTLPANALIVAFATLSLWSDDNSLFSTVLNWTCIIVLIASSLLTLTMHYGLPLRRGGLLVGRWPPKDRLKWRWLARAWARVFGYFWLPCPVCHEPFAGFEWGEYSMMTGDAAGTGVCARPSCQAVAEASAKEFYAKQGRRLIGQFGGQTFTVPLNDMPKGDD